MTTDDISGMGPLVARLSRGGQRLRHADRAHPWVLDTGVVLVVLLMFCLPDLLRGSVGNGDAPRRFRLAFTELPVAGMLALQAGLVLPLLWRRRKPMAAFGVIAAVFALQWSLGAALRADVALFIALYSLALHGRLRQLPWAGAVMAGAMLLVAVRASSAVSVWDALFFLLSTATAALALGLMVRIRRAQLAGLRERAARLEIERDQRSRLATATERTRVAREMHDIVGHNLSVIITLADAGAYATDVAPERGKEALRLIGDTGRQALGELRRVLGVLREAGDGPAGGPELSPQPGIADIGALCATVRAAGLGVVYRTSGDVDALDGGVQLTVYRIVQEALTNTMKHAAGDARVHLAVVVTGARLSIRVQDTGPAARPGPPNEAGQGLVGMRERAALYGGTVSAGPTGGGGWSVEAVLDLTPQGGDR
ncbi:MULTISPECIES: sensor histidine kinase [Streptomyces]|uniref:sensor histidine kinase n=1 Tax=Streptomyces TaxID=1883 RepID=UPI0002E46688|nr:MULTISPECIES: sensor histidine kinase [Streptomyces]MDX2928623.1 sensor histidine kinase [Streptomyces sp. NRRL_B-16638]MDX3350427.1 sensor histidine kinase [Streptomyces sp. ME02-6979A]MDX3369793.1 sensor histidine kinase [Streptomyces sp. ME02-6987-2C]MDX3404668.1 sensor histidine kinase [Streptomyces sp. ME02-6977A]MDX3426888.1 sensor histidine kinase [Streptomyces sp. ME02-6985-2c]